MEIIGTSHISAESVEKVKKRILTTKPDFVAVELDRQRFLALRQGQSKITLAVAREVGFFGYLFAKFGHWMQQKLGEQVGLVPGTEMLSAIESARNVGAKIVLIDRPVHITFQRLSAIPFGEKLKLFGYVILSLVWPERIEFDITKVPEEKVIEKLMAQLKLKFPNLFAVLITERDLWMARALDELENNNPDAKIIAVVGAGHAKGIRKNLTMGGR